LNIAVRLGLLKKNGELEGYYLTDIGKACRTLSSFRETVYSDVVHFLFYSIWETHNHQDYWSWTYSRACEILWRQRPFLPSRRAIFGELSAIAMKEFPNLSPSMGTETVGAILGWLEGLSPSFLILEEGRLVSSRDREWFSPELAILGISYVCYVRQLPVQAPLLLDESTLCQLSNLCLATTETVLAIIETAASTFPFLSIHVGEWGSSVVLEQQVNVVDLV
jgi:hypothetical protein